MTFEGTFVAFILVSARAKQRINYQHNEFTIMTNPYST